jgi:hypothetical protein
VTYQILNGTNATPEVDFAINPAPMIFIGDTNSVQSQMMLFVNNDVWEPDKVQWMQLAKWAFWGDGSVLVGRNFLGWAVVWRRPMDFDFVK